MTQLSLRSHKPKPDDFIKSHCRWPNLWLRSYIYLPLLFVIILCNMALWLWCRFTLIANKHWNCRHCMIFLFCAIVTQNTECCWKVLVFDFSEYSLCVFWNVTCICRGSTEVHWRRMFGINHSSSQAERPSSCTVLASLYISIQPLNPMNGEQHR